MKKGLTIFSILLVVVFYVVPLFVDNLTCIIHSYLFGMVLITGTAAGLILKYIIKRFKPTWENGIHWTLGIFASAFLWILIYFGPTLLSGNTSPILWFYLWVPLYYGGFINLIVILLDQLRKRTAKIRQIKPVKITLRVFKVFVCVVAGMNVSIMAYINWGVTATVDTNRLGNAAEPLIARETHSRHFNMRKITAMPVPDRDGIYNLSFADATDADFTNKTDSLMMADFSDKTVWPEAMPEDFSHERIMALGLNPGLGIRELHKRGITGTNVGIAVIDQNLPVAHEEYTDCLRVYEWCQASALIEDGGAAMHSFVASMAAGKNAGVAPGADLYYISSTFGFYILPGYITHYYSLVAAIGRVLEINEHLPEDKKIRVVSISKGFNARGEIGSKAFRAAIDRANEAGVFVITCSPEVNFNFTLMGLGREPLDDPDDVSSYTPGIFWNDQFIKNNEWYNEQDMLLVPMDSRAGASFTGDEVYAFYRSGGLSWATPWLAGMYALCVQVYPAITPDLFISLAFETGDEITVEKNDETYQLKTLINPIRLIEKLESL